MTVEAVKREVEGWRKDVSSVCLLPFFPILFGCGGDDCAKDLARKMQVWYDWDWAKLAFNKCDFCFKLAETVHRLNQSNHWTLIM